MIKNSILSFALLCLLIGCGEVKNINPLHGLGGDADTALFHFEDGTLMGLTSGAASVASVPGSLANALNTDQVSFFGQRSMQWQIVNMNNGGNADAAMEYMAPAPVNLEAKTVRVFVWAPAEAAPSSSQPAWCQIYLKQGVNFANFGRNLLADGWSEVSFDVQSNTGSAISDGFLSVPSGFDASAVDVIGIRVSLSGAAPADYNFNGNIFVDSLTW